MEEGRGRRPDQVRAVRPGRSPVSASPQASCSNDLPFCKIMNDVFQNLDVLRFVPIYKHDRSIFLNRKVFNLHIALSRPFFRHNENLGFREERGKFCLLLGRAGYWNCAGQRMPSVACAGNDAPEPLQELSVKLKQSAGKVFYCFKTLPVSFRINCAPPPQLNPVRPATVKKQRSAQSVRFRYLSAGFTAYSNRAGSADHCETARLSFDSVGQRKSVYSAFCLRRLFGAGEFETGAAP